MTALLPLIVFLLVYLVTSIVAGDFYAVPVSAAFLVACVFAIATSKGKLEKRLEIFSSGAGNSRVLMMVWIFILAGAFSGTARDIGAVEATVNATLRIIPPQMLYAGLFLTSCFISMSIGTSVGTIVALMPIAREIAQLDGLSAPFLAAIIVGGAFFGDNMSFISDTTIAATKALGCDMKDKFKANFSIVAPAMLLVAIIYLVLGHNLDINYVPKSIEWAKMIPYLLVIVLALVGADVCLILVIGIIVNGIIGAIYGTFTWTLWLGSLGKGISEMNDLIVVCLLAGGLLAIMDYNGAMAWIMKVLTSHIKSKKGAQLSIAALVCLANVCTANNTIAIITTGRIAKDITERFSIDPRKTASILDTFSCFVQSYLPYGAQLLMASGLCACSPVSIMKYLIYPLVMVVFALIAIILGLPRKYSR